MLEAIHQQQHVPSVLSFGLPPPPASPPPMPSLLAPAGLAVSYIFPVTFHWVAYYGRARYQAQKAEAEADLAALAGSTLLVAAGSLAAADTAGKMPAVETAGKDGSEQRGGQQSSVCLDSSVAGGAIAAPQAAPAPLPMLPSPFEAVVQLAPNLPAEDEPQLPGIPGGWAAGNLSPSLRLVVAAGSAVVRDSSGCGLCCCHHLPLQRAAAWTCRLAAVSCSPSQASTRADPTAPSTCCWTCCTHPSQVGLAWAGLGGQAASCAFNCHCVHRAVLVCA